jgi:glycosyltransferase involved in cell wall biosynthesis
MRNFMKNIVLQSAYTYATLCERNLLDFATSKNLDGFFEETITVHPASTLEFDVNSKERYGKISIHYHSVGQIFVEAKAGRYWAIRNFQKLNFLLSQIGLLLFLFKLTRRQKGLLIRAEDPRYNGIIGYLLTKVNRAPFIVGTWGNPDTIRRFTLRPLQPRIFPTVKAEERCERFLMKRAKCVLVQNEDNFNYAVSYGAREENVKYFRLGNAIYPGHFLEPHRRLANIDITKSDVNICTVSRLEKLKLVDHAIMAFADMKHKGVSQLYIFGDGNEKEALKDLSFRLGVADRVNFMGNVDQETLSQMLVRMNLVLSPLMGRALTESALAALPIVAYNIDCHPEIVKTNVSGILVKYLDYQAMAKAADYLVEHVEESTEMGLVARTVALDLMDPTKLIEEQRGIFSKLLQEYCKVEE